MVAQVGHFSIGISGSVLHWR